MAKLRVMILLRSTLVLALLSAAGQALAAPEYAGHYDNVRYVEEAGDLVGYRVTVRTGPKPTVAFEICQGECNGARVFPAWIEGDRISFGYARGGLSSMPAVPVTGRFVRDGLILQFAKEPPEKLRKRKAIPR